MRIRYTLAIATFIFALVATTFGSDAVPEGLTVDYALVPKERLQEAVEGKKNALEVEETYIADLKSSPVYPVHTEHFSVVIFVDNTTGARVAGKLGILMEQERPVFSLNVSLGPGHNGTYVIDGGGLYLAARWLDPDAREHVWLDLDIH